MNIPPISEGHGDIADVDADLGLPPLDLELGDFGGVVDPSSVFDPSFLEMMSNPSAYQYRCGSTDIPSYHSPSTTETESIESYTSSGGGGLTSGSSTGGTNPWDYTSVDGESLGDVCETFDLILESEQEGQSSSPSRQMENQQAGMQ